MRWKHGVIVRRITDFFRRDIRSIASVENIPRFLDWADEYVFIFITTRGCCRAIETLNIVRHETSKCVNGVLLQSSDACLHVNGCDRGRRIGRHRTQ